ncbi:MAG: LapA family protein [Zetaproteobacteria bacterium]|nr:MAG: LapA family protein [Zetaproteobacteria bacterium]
MNWINALVVALFSAVATIFALANSGEVAIAFTGIGVGHSPLYVPVFAAFVLGYVGGVLSLAFSRRKHKRRILELEAENRQLHSEVENLRNIPLQEEL